MLVMVVFMLMYMLMYMLNPAGLMPMQMYHNKTGAMTMAVSTLVVLAVGTFLVPWPQRAGTAPGNVTLDLGQALMGSKMLVMLINPDLRGHRASVARCPVFAICDRSRTPREWGRDVRVRRASSSWLSVDIYGRIPTAGRPTPALVRQRQHSRII